MQGERAQASIEYVGVLLLVATLVGALIGAFGTPSLAARIVTSVGQALVGTIGRSDRDEAIAASAAEQGLFDSAVDRKQAPDDRPSLRDVRLQLIAAHGDEAGREIYEQLVLEQLRKVIPELSEPTTFPTAGPNVVVPRTASNLQTIDAEHSLAKKLSPGDAGELESPASRPDVHVVTVSEADEKIGRALHPGVSLVGVATDVVGAVPLGGVAVHLGHLAVTAEKIANAAEYGAGSYAVYRDAESFGSTSEALIPAGAREGDELVSWIAVRRPTGGGPARRFARSAVVRDGVVIDRGIALLDPGSFP
jgi:hypothetical protein